MLLQAESASAVIENSFNTNPDTVFGVLVSILILAIVSLVIGIWKLDKRHEINVNAIHKDHKEEMKSIFEAHERSDAQKYQDMKNISEKMIEASTSMLSKLDELIRSRSNV